MGIVAAQPVDAEHIEKVSLFQTPDQLPIGRPSKILAGLLVDKDMPAGYSRLPKRDQLPGLVLFRAGNPGIAINLRFLLVHVFYFTSFSKIQEGRRAEA